MGFSDSFKFQFFKDENHSRLNNICFNGNDNHDPTNMHNQGLGSCLGLVTLTQTNILLMKGTQESNHGNHLLLEWDP
jgi:hypothetical protein